MFKTKTILLCLLLCSLNRAYAIVEFGFKVAGGTSMIDSKDQIMPVNKFGPPLKNIYAPIGSFTVATTAGFWVNTGDVFYIQPELNFSQKGGVFKFGSSEENVKVTVNFYNIEMPMLLGTKLSTEWCDFNVVIGPSFQVNIANTQNFSSNVELSHPKFSSYRKTFLSLQQGVSFLFKSLRLDIRTDFTIPYIDYNYEQRIFSGTVGLAYLIYNGRATFE